MTRTSSLDVDSHRPGWGLGREHIVDALRCRETSLRSRACLESLVQQLIEDVALIPVGQPQWHQFPGHAGVTGLVLLTESHLAVHTFPEYAAATFSLFSCRPHRDWAWAERLEYWIGAGEVTVRTIDRGAGVLPEFSEGPMAIRLR